MSDLYFDPESFPIDDLDLIRRISKKEKRKKKSLTKEDMVEMQREEFVSIIKSAWVNSPAAIAVDLALRNSSAFNVIAPICIEIDDMRNKIVDGAKKELKEIAREILKPEAGRKRSKINKMLLKMINNI